MLHHKIVCQENYKMKKQVRFDSKHAFINKNSYELITNPELNTEKNATEVDNLASENHMDIMWEKLVLYYLSRLKGLCDWRLNEGTQKPESSTSSTSIESQSSSLSDNIEQDIVKKVITGLTKETCDSKKNTTDFGTYMAAGYEAGKHQAAKIVIRSLKYGILTGILIKTGSSYKIRPKYLRKQKLQPRLKNCKRKRITKTKCCDHSRKTKKIFGTEMKLRNRRKIVKSNRIQSHYCLCNDVKKVSLHSLIKKKERSRSSTISGGKISSNSVSPESSGGLIAKKKKLKIKLKKPVIVKRPPRKRNKSQSKSPTPLRSNSNSSHGKYKPRKLRNRREIRRNSSVLSSMSSINGVYNHCYRKRPASSCSSSEKNVKRMRHKKKK